MQKRKTRTQVPLEQTWRLEDLFACPEDWEAEAESAASDIGTVTRYKGHLGESASVLRACVDAEEALRERLDRLDTYASNRFAEDGSNPNNQALYDKMGALAAKVNAALSFIRPELLALPDGTVERFVAEEPALATLRHYFRQLLDLKPHTLLPETEQALAALGEVHRAPYSTYLKAKSSDVRFPPFVNGQGQEVENSFAVYEDDYEGSADVTTRRNAYASFGRGLEAYQNTFASTLGTEVKKQVVLARLRGFPSAIHMQLRHHQVPPEAYHNLLDIIQAELAPHMRRYAALRRRVLGLDRLLYCDIEAPLDPGYDPKISYEEGCRLILEALEVMGPEYGQLMHTALTERWVDRADNVGKATGAFCASPYRSHPFVLITWTDTMRSAFVLAHELGHAGHFGLANRHQRFHNVEPTWYFIEAPSTMNELLLGQHILAQSSGERVRRWVIMQMLATYHHNFVRHLLEGELQRRIFSLAEAGEPISAVTLSEAKGAILERFWGGEVEIDQGSRLTWMRQPHYYMGLYPYTYSAGLTCATAVARMIREEGQPAVDRWLQVLKAGGTRPPLELMQMAGVDMTTPAPIRTAVDYVGSLVAELEKSFGT